MANSDDIREISDEQFLELVGGERLLGADERSLQQSILFNTENPMQAMAEGQGSGFIYAFLLAFVLEFLDPGTPDPRPPGDDSVPGQDDDGRDDGFTDDGRDDGEDDDDGGGPSDAGDGSGAGESI